MGLIIMILLGGIAILGSTVWRDWSNTHNKLFQRTQPVSSTQSRINLIVGTAAGALAIAV